MELFHVIIIAIALAMDAFSVSVSGGATLKKVGFKQILLVAIYFGFFQYLMANIGWQGGTLLSNAISSFDHWIAFGLLFFIACKMMWESTKDSTERTFSLSTPVLLILALSTSIDALGVGMSYALLDKPIFLPSIIIGIIAFAFSGLGIILGKVLKNILNGYAEIFGAIILIIIGINILAEHGVFL